jgi:hypothetical protein
MPLETKKTPWFLKPPAVAIAVLCAGPFALPLVWMSPALKRRHKWLITILITVITIWLFKASADLFNILFKEMQALQETMR